MSVVQTFKCVHCGNKVTRRVPKRKAWHKSYCSGTNRYVRLQAVTKV